MTVQINSNYLETYSKEYAQLVCDRFFNGRQFITGQEIIQLTSSIQVNFFVIKRLFELWQEELAKLKSSPYFDYRDIAVHEALTQFMNVLSRRIKVERAHLEPMVKTAVKQAIEVATEPVSFYQGEIKKAPAGKINEFLRENKKYYKWHDKVITFLIDKTGFGHDADAYHRAISANYQVIKDSLESVNLLLATLGEVRAFNLDLYMESEIASPASPITDIPQSSPSSFFEEIEEDEIIPANPAPVQEAARIQSEVIPVVRSSNPASAGVLLTASKLKVQFSSESYKGMKGIIGELSESLALNQRFMFTKELFDGNADLLRHALKSIDESGSFEAAVELVNNRFVSELSWETESEAVQEFMRLVYRKFLD
ncbi:MAG: hypothetical protein ACK4SF_13075 [Algoriphagus aquaeductus]|uniref:Uncharacterized protein n=1 Tax=Algoriphagus aquaeductus TaxID=475299 RepID=A0A326RMG4_9BACT|nr:hypothetical protein [Algoriphagus aquaeductus]PZV78555.1 hypothetical protein CLV31_11763 [Algoriphagus aquaeductus]